MPEEQDRLACTVRRAASERGLDELAHDVAAPQREGEVVGDRVRPVSLLLDTDQRLDRPSLAREHTLDGLGRVVVLDGPESQSLARGVPLLASVVQQPPKVRALDVRSGGRSGVTAAGVIQLGLR